MKLEHIAVAANSEEQADRFFVELLGLTRTRTSSVPAEMNRDLFGVDGETPMLRYGREGIDIEVFVTADESRAVDRFTHCCLVVEDRKAFCERARAMGLKVIEVAKRGGAGTVVFVDDFFGNRYEIK